MSAATATATTTLGQVSRSIGDVKMQIMDIGVISGDVSATATATGLSAVKEAILVLDVVQTAQPTFSGNVATFAFTDPVATVKGKVILLGT